MRIEQAIEYADQLLYDQTGRHLNDLQSYIIQQSWQGRTYGQVATLAGYSEGHVKDVASQLWKLLSTALGERITKGNLRSRLINRIRRTLKKAASTGSLPPTQAMSNPDFVGREHALLTIQSLSQRHPVVLIQGEGGLGKTTLARRHCQQFDRVIELLLSRAADQVTPAESVAEEWLIHHFNQSPSQDFGMTLSRLKAQLEQHKNSVVWIDNLESVLDRNGQFTTMHRRYVELLGILSMTKTTTVITSRDRLCEPSLKVYHYRLPCLSLLAWQQFFRTHLKQAYSKQAGSKQANPNSSQLSTIQAMHRAYGGNAKAMEILCMAAVEDFEGNLDAYWQENKANLLSSADFRNLISGQIDRLRSIDLEAYRVFCRLGNDTLVPGQTQQGLSADAILTLMWDIPHRRRRCILNSLCDRSILALQKGLYQLHPVTRAEAARRSHHSSHP